MPVLFLGHGSPMNAVEENEFVTGWRDIASTFPKPEAVLCISAHWLSRGTFISAGQKPAIIYDFGGFPQKLYDFRYQAPGSPALAEEIRKNITVAEVKPDTIRGLDHGCWSIMSRLYPDADVPVVQLSIDYYQTAQFHYDLGRELQYLRSKGVLIIGSGNIVHNLEMIDWENINGGYPWAKKANEIMIKLVRENNHAKLINFRSSGKEMKLAIPTADHYFPLLYLLAMKTEDENISFFNNNVVMGSLSMTSLKIG